jgi:N-acetylglucosamine-6-phosphate deacetylase
MKTKLLIEQHFHGAYGVDFNTATVDDILFLAKKIIKDGVGYIFPTLVTDSVDNIKRQIQVIKLAANKQTSDMARICGVHLEGIFLNPEKKGIHNSDYFLKPTLENFKLIEDDFIKMVTLAPEFADVELLNYLRSKGIKIQAGHCVGGDLSKCDGVTHMFNAMAGITHRASSTALSALIDDDIYTEIIADGVHVKDDALKLLLKVKQMNKIILISDCLPCTHSDIKEFEFAGSKIYYDGIKATSKDGTLAGSTKLLSDIVKILGQKGLFSKQFISNSYEYHNLESYGEIEWDDDFNIVNITIS